MNLGLGKPCKCLHCKSDMYRKRLYDHIRSKHKDQYETRKEQEGTFKPIENQDFTFEDVDIDKLKEESDIPVQKAHRQVNRGGAKGRKSRDSSAMLSSGSSSSSDESDYKSWSQKKKKVNRKTRNSENPEDTALKRGSKRIAANLKKNKES